MNFFTVLSILFIGLKLANIITWSWWLVLLPLYGGLVFIFFAAFIAIIAGKR